MPDLPMSKKEKYYDRSAGSVRELHQYSPDILKRANAIFLDGIFMEEAITECNRYTPDFKDEKYISKFEYHPFQDYYDSTEKNLYEKFACLDINNTEEILTFIKEFGFLEKETSRFSGKQPSQYYETLDKWRYEILYMQIVLLFISLLSKKTINYDDIKKLRNEYSFLSENLFSTETSKKLYLDKENIDIMDSIVFSDVNINQISHNNEYYRHVIEFIISYTQMIINERIKSVHPALYIKVNGLSDNKYTFDIDEYWSFNNLLEAMYLMIYLDLLKGKRLIRCVVCDEYFILKKNERFREYCSKKQCENNYRKRSKNKYAKKRSTDEGLKYYDKLNKKMNKRKTNKVKKISDRQYNEWLKKAKKIKSDYLKDRNIERLKNRLDEISKNELIFKEDGGE